MCRLLTVCSKNPFAITPHLEKFAQISKNSKEYQGHGWGCAYRDAKGSWKFYKNITPVWEDNLSRFEATTLLVAHARSAFEDKNIDIANNMPFFDGKTVYVFNGELRGVKIREEGRIGAEKIFNYIRRFDQGDMRKALVKAIEIIKRRTRYIKAMNIILVTDGSIIASSLFNEDDEYFTLRYKEEHELIICSEPYPSEDSWEAIANDCVRVW